MHRPHRIHLIACGVLAVDIRHLAEEMRFDLSAQFLKGGLHEKPTELRQQLQAAIDESSSSRQFDRIVIGYGICGRGTVGIESRDIPLVLPKAHDCIAMFLGSDQAYREQFARFPGTFYISAGWYEEKAEPLAQARHWVIVGDRRMSYAELLEKFGAENAKELFSSLSSWQRNYQRAAFIDTGVKGSSRYADYAKAMAKEFGWRYENIEGDLSLLKKLLQADQTTDEVLIVPPGYRTVYDPASGTLSSNPLWGQGESPRPIKRKVVLVGDKAGETAQKKSSAKIGLGIDAGGTYTDAVVYDLAVGKVLDKKKALTTKWDLTVGIDEVLAGLDETLIESVNLVAVSTTLATNAIVEGKGQKVGLLVMPPYGLFKPEDIAHEPKAVISGRLEITGEQIQPVDEQEVRQKAREMLEHFSVKAFAVSGFAGAINPEHELLVKKALRDETGLSVTCGHELSDIPDFLTRAQTAVMNGRITPLLIQLLTDLDRVLRRRRIKAPVVVVKGDGTLMKNDVALERPVETILSGPAASVAGANHLTGEQDAIVVDMGGTTTDTAMLKNGRVSVCTTGSNVGGARTHVKALQIRTIGLGGDSYIAWNGVSFEIGPQRVAPMAWLGKQGQDVDKALDFLMKHIDDYKGSTKQMQILTQPGRLDGLQLTPMEAEIVKLLQERPSSLQEIAQRTGLPHWSVLPIDRLEERFLVQRCGLTPTDLLNGIDAIALWDKDISLKICEMLSEVTGIKTREMIDNLLDEIVRQLALEVFKRQLDEETEPDRLNDCEVCQVLINNMLNSGGLNYTLQLRLHQPIIGIGAPVHHFLPRAASLLRAKSICPEHAEVANAIGAVTSQVQVQRQVRIRPSQAGGFVIEGLPGAKRLMDLGQATTHAEENLIGLVREAAKISGTSENAVEVRVEDQTAPVRDGTQIFLGRTISAQLTGQPDPVLSNRM